MTTGRKYRNVIFDFDGTLADTNSGIVLTFRRTLEELGIPCPADEVISATIGLPLRDCFTKAVPGITDAQADEAVVVYHRLFDGIAIPAVTAFPGVPEMLLELRRRGVRTAIATSRGRRSLTLIVGRLNLGDCFDCMFAAEDVTNHKPAPDTALLAMERLGCSAAGTLVVGDTTYDLMMGHSAGCDVCGVTWGNQSLQQLESADPEYIVDRMEDLLKLV